jgi:hypothetical protein
MLILVLFLQGCALTSPRIEHTPTPAVIGAPISEPEGTALLFEDFSDPDSGWEVGEYNGGSIGYVDGEYFVTSTKEAEIMWGQAALDLDDVIIEVNARQVAGPSNDDTGYGVMCRVSYNPDEDTLDAYALRISPDGYYAITKFFQNTSSHLVEWTSSDVIRLGPSTNSINARCEGDHLTLIVNGVMLAETWDTSYVHGDVGLTGTSYEAEPAEFRFDHVIISLP